MVSRPDAPSSGGAFLDYLFPSGAGRQGDLGVDLWVDGFLSGAERDRQLDEYPHQHQHRAGGVGGAEVYVLGEQAAEGRAADHAAGQGHFVDGQAGGAASGRP